MFRIPDTVAGVKKKLVGASELATGAQWEIAAYVWALRQEGVTPSEIASWGIVGLKSTNAVTSRTTAYQKAIDEGLAEKVRFGEQVTLPEADYFDYAPAAGGANNLTNVTFLEDYDKHAEREGTTVGMAVRAGRNVAALKAAIKADPRVAEVARVALTERNSEAAARAAERKAAEDEPIVDLPTTISSWMLIQRKAKKELAELLGATSDLPRTKEVSEIVELAVEELRPYLEAIATVHAGKSLDAELVALLEGGAE